MAIFQTFLFMFIECSTFFSSLLYFLLIPTNIKFEPHEKTIWINLLICDGFFSRSFISFEFLFSVDAIQTVFLFLKSFYSMREKRENWKKEKKVEKIH